MIYSPFINHRTINVVDFNSNGSFFTATNKSLVFCNLEFTVLGGGSGNASVGLSNSINNNILSAVISGGSITSQIIGDTKVIKLGESIDLSFTIDTKVNGTIEIFEID